MTPENSWLVRSTMTEVGPRGRELPERGPLGRARHRARGAADARGVGEPRGRARSEPSGAGATCSSSCRPPTWARWRGSAWSTSLAAEPPRVEPPPPPPAHITWAPLRLARGKLDFDPLADAQEDRWGQGRRAAGRAARHAALHPPPGGAQQGPGAGGERPGRAVRGAGVGVRPGCRRPRPRAPADRGGPAPVPRPTIR